MGMNGYMQAVSGLLARELLTNNALVLPIVLAGAQGALAGLVPTHGGAVFEVEPDQNETEAALNAAGFRADDLREPLTLGPAWHAIHYTLAGTAWEATDPPGDAVLGGVDVGDAEEGVIRVVTPEDVAATSAALAALTPEVFATRIDLDGMAEHDIYGEWEGSDERQLLQQMYATLRAYYADAAARADGMLLYVL